MNKTKIEWAKNPDGTQGYTWNPITGCLNHINGMCKGGNFPCYAYKLAHGRLKKVYAAGGILALPDIKSIDGGCEDLDKHLEDVGKWQTDPFYPRLWEERLDEYLGICRGIFVCDMSDLFGIGVPEEWTRAVLDRIRRSSHRNHYYLLTKQPQNLPKFSPFPPNCWVGVTATGYKAFNEALDHLKTIASQVKYISMEPLLEEIKVCPERLKYCGVSQLIIGAQTRPYKPPKIEWLQEIVEAADKAGVPVFLKDNLRPLIATLSAGKAFYYYDDQTCELRQEFPK
jgi:protein gp37